MSQPINLADPAFEPSDEQLIGLSARAFSGVAAAHEASLARLREQIAAAREESLRLMETRAPGRREA